MTATNSIGEFGLANTYSNRGASLFTALDQQSSKLAFDMMEGSSNLQVILKPQVYVAPAAAVAAGSPFYVAHYLACIKLRDSSDDLKKCPMQKNTRGFICLNYHSSSTILITTGTAGVVTPSAIAGLSNNMSFGNTRPVLWNLNSGATTAALAGGLALPALRPRLRLMPTSMEHQLQELVSLHLSRSRVSLSQHTCQIQALIMRSTANLLMVNSLPGAILDPVGRLRRQHAAVLITDPWARSPGEEDL